MQALLLRVLPAARVALAMQFFRFGVVGVCGFVTTTAVVYATRRWLGASLAILPGFALGVTATWLLNRFWTFRGHGSRALPLWREWAMFAAANSLGFSLNASVYWALIAISPLCAANPVLPLLAGTLAGMFVNFFLSRHVVFR